MFAKIAAEVPATAFPHGESSFDAPAIGNKQVRLVVQIKKIRWVRRRLDLYHPPLFVPRPGSSSKWGPDITPPLHNHNFGSFNPTACPTSSICRQQTNSTLFHTIFGQSMYRNPQFLHFRLYTETPCRQLDGPIVLSLSGRGNSICPSHFPVAPTTKPSFPIFGPAPDLSKTVFKGLYWLLIGGSVPKSLQVWFAGVSCSARLVYLGGSAAKYSWAGFADDSGLGYIYKLLVMYELF